MKRAGVDTWGAQAVHFHLSADRCLALLAPEALYVVEVGEGVPPDEAPLRPGTVVVLGPEDGSVDPRIAEAAQGLITLPMFSIRSLNLAQCAAVVAFEALRQQRS